MTASKFIITAAAVSSLMMSASSTKIHAPPTISSLVASSRSGLFGLNREKEMSHGWNVASVLRGGSTGE